MTLELWQAMAEDVDAGGAFTITAGCDKHFKPCKAKLDKVRTSAASPMYRASIALTYPGRAGNNDGGSMN